jgi:integrase
MARNASQKNRLWFKQDGTFRVIAERRTDRMNSFRVRFWTVGSRFKYLPAESVDECIQLAQSVWADHLNDNEGIIKKEINTILGLSEAFWSRSSLRPASKRYYKQCLTEFAEFVGDRRHFSRIYSTDVKRFLDSRTCSERSKKTKLRGIKCLFNWAMKRKLITDNPASSITISVKTRIRPYLVPDEFESFLNACKPSFRLRALFTLETGCRAGELVNLRWSSVFLDQDKPFVLFEENKETDFIPKWGKRGAVPLSKTAVSCLEEARILWPKSDYVFSDKFIRVRTNLCRDTHMASRKAGTTDIDFHGLRRSAAIRWLMNGVPIHVVSQLLRHSSIDITIKHYGWLMTNELARHIEGF